MPDDSITAIKSLHGTLKIHASLRKRVEGIAKDLRQVAEGLEQEERYIRANLRKLGHYGGGRKPPGWRIQK